ncbi:MAG: hypothetical protein HC780_13150 [Leptolyngbyaceae cyanobacterium CSU_1_3]|nr:hypothetical protein [Leptolyngbyaceae cyanobacterium CSU_1_3]
MTVLLPVRMSLKNGPIAPILTKLNLGIAGDFLQAHFCRLIFAGSSLQAHFAQAGCTSRAAIV